MGLGAGGGGGGGGEEGGEAEGGVLVWGLEGEMGG